MYIYISMGLIQWCYLPGLQGLIPNGLARLGVKEMHVCPYGMPVVVIFFHETSVDFMLYICIIYVY